MKRCQRVLFWSVTTIFVLLVIVGVILPNLAGSQEGVAIIRTLPLGWLNFLIRTLPEVTVNWAGIGMVVLCSALILACLHSLLSALTQRRFRFRWSVAIFASVWLLFCLIIAVAGLSRTTALLQNENWYRVRLTRGDLWSASTHASMSLSKSGNDLSYLKRLLLHSEGKFGRPLWEEFEFMVCPPAQGKSPCIVVIPMEPKTRERIGFSIVSEAGSEDSIPIAKLHERLAALKTAESR